MTNKMLTPEQSSRLTRIYDQLDALKESLEELAEETACESIETAASDVDDALDELDEIIERDGPSIVVHVQKDNGAPGEVHNVTDEPEQFMRLLQSMAENRDEDEDEDDDDSQDRSTIAMLSLIRHLSETCSREKLREILRETIEILD